MKEMNKIKGEKTSTENPQRENEMRLINEPMHGLFKLKTKMNVLNEDGKCRKRMPE